jgi:hypothetical protein
MLVTLARNHNNSVAAGLHQPIFELPLLPSTTLRRRQGRCQDPLPTTPAMSPTPLLMLLLQLWLLPQQGGLCHSCHRTHTSTSTHSTIRIHTVPYCTIPCPAKNRAYR